ncbi:MAG TPA: TonB-dependent receptor [Pyrinomonadaceae bacterium]
MKSRYFFRLTLALCVTITLFLVQPPNRASARAAQDKPGPVTQGSLLALDDAGQPTQLCPLKHTSVKAEISGFLSRVEVTQEFENPFKEKIEAVYTFPLPQNAAVDDMTMIVGERKVRGRIMRREEAQATYAAAKSKGQVASLLDQERPNIFTQSVANIMPGERVTVVISYVETLKYEDGSYQFVFPMVVGERYIPSSEAGQQQQADSLAHAQQGAPDAARLSPPSLPQGERAGHDISIEVALDAGVPLDSLASASHEVTTERQDWSRAVVRLKDQETIPNKDFILKYDVAGRKIEDAVLTHHSNRGGFFTMILQPPERVTAEDVMPKELVFVIDSSGSMGGFPFDKAVETAKLALDNLYPQDTFNLITFSGDEHILFPEPVAATPENLRRAKKFLDGSRSGGGTEMMKAVRAAFNPSDAQGHVRIVCFMTDGYVGNDMEILAEIQKRSNARVFAMGFGSAPNRFLLDKMAEYGLGEVEYVTETDADAKEVARRFHERVRNPLLTNLSIDWAGLPVADVYPQRIPDLFSAKPVVLTGRFTGAGKGVIRLKGKMSGRDFVREIPVELPEAQPQHDVLATLWARQRIDDLMGQDMAGAQAGSMKKELREEITQLGLDFRLMTQFTSFVAVGEEKLNDGNEPRRVDVPAVPVSTGDTAVAGSATANNPGSVSAYVTVEASGRSYINTSASSIVTVSTIENLPLNGRSFQSLLLLAPGTVSTGANQPGQTLPDQVSVNGQRPTSNSYFIDGVSANIGIAPGQNPGPTAAGTVPGMTASGGTSNLASVETMKEATIVTHNFQAEYGRSTGAQFSIVTRSGTNTFSGSLYEFFGNDALDASDWFANSRGLGQPPRRLNNFGGTFGGPLKRDKAFFFASYDGLRLRQPLVGLTDVPSIASRRLASLSLQSFLNAYPLPSGAERSDGFAEFAASDANPARHDAASFRADWNPTSSLSLSGRYNYAASNAQERGAGLFSLNTLNNVRSRTQTLTGSASYTLSPTVMAELRGNYSRLNARSILHLDEFGGAVVNANTSLSSNFDASQRAFSTFDLNGRNAALANGGDVANAQRQFNLVGSVTQIAGNHTLKFGADYRRLAPVIGVQPFEQSILFNRVATAIDGMASRVNLFARVGQEHPVFTNLSFYGQDEWHATSRLTLNYGLRWEINPPPSASEGPEPFSITDASDLSRLRLAASGARLWQTTYGNFAPRVGLAYQFSQARGRETVARASFNALYDIGSAEAGLAFSDSFPFLAGQTRFDVPFPSALIEPSTLNPQLPASVPFVAFDPHLKLPYTLQWAVDVEQSLGSDQLISASYVGSIGRRLLLAQTFLNPSPDFPLVRLTTNGAESDYQAMQLQFNRRLSHGLQAMASYTWAKSIDNASQDSLSRTLLRSSDAQQERAVSDFDVRHLLNAMLTYSLPSPRLNGWSYALLRNWSIDAIFNARGARPINVVYGVPTSYGFAYLRPDLLAGVPIYLDDAAEGGGRRLNPAAFAIPSGGRQGTLGRNSLRGFPLYQFDLALSRQFNFTERVKLQFKVAAFNLFNHPNFEDPLGTDTSLGSRLSAAGAFLPNETFGRSASLLGRSLWGGAGRSFSSFYQVGGPRTLQLSLKLQF